MAGTNLGTLVTYNPWSIGPTALLDDVAARFEELRVHHVPVVDGQRRVIGILSDADLLRARQAKRPALVAAGGMSSSEHDTGDAPAVFARDCMSRDVHTISPAADFAAALSLLLDRRIHALPVVEGGVLVGMVTSRDFLREFSYGELPGGRDGIARYLPSKRPEAIHPRSTLDEALLAMQEAGVSCLIVAQGASPLGVVSQRDIVRQKCRLRESEEQGDGRPATVREATRCSPAIGSGQRLCEAAAALVAHELPAVTVVNPANELVGLITEDDLLRVLYDAQA